MSRELDLTDPACRAELVRLTVTGAIGGLLVGTVLGETRRFALIGTLVGGGLGVLSCTNGDPSRISDDEDADEDDNGNALRTTNKDGTGGATNKDGTTAQSGLFGQSFTVLAGDDVDDYSFTVEGAS